MTPDDLNLDDGETREERLRRRVEEMAAQSAVYRGKPRRPAEAIPPPAPSPSPRRARPAKEARAATGSARNPRKDPIDIQFRVLANQANKALEAARERRADDLRRHVASARAARARILAATPAPQVRWVQRRLRPYMKTVAIARDIARRRGRASRRPAP
jgi:hypothetical protein